MKLRYSIYPSSLLQWSSCCRLNCAFMNKEEHNQWWFTTSMNELNTFRNKNISLILFSKGAHSLLLVWEKYTQRGEFFLSNIFFWESGGCQRLHSHCKPYRQRRPNVSDRLRVHRPRFSALSKSARVVLITWSLSGYTPAGLDCPDALSSPCLLITTWQLIKAHGITRNEPKIHVICYITQYFCIEMIHDFFLVS